MNSSSGTHRGLNIVLGGSGRKQRKNQNYLRPSSNRMVRAATSTQYQAILASGAAAASAGSIGSTRIDRQFACGQQPTKISTANRPGIFSGFMPLTCDFSDFQPNIGLRGLRNGPKMQPKRMSQKQKSSKSEGVVSERSTRKKPVQSTGRESW